MTSAIMPRSLTLSRLDRLYAVEEAHKNFVTFNFAKETQKEEDLEDYYNQKELTKNRKSAEKYLDHVTRAFNGSAESRIRLEDAGDRLKKVFHKENLASRSVLQKKLSKEAVLKKSLESC